MINERKKILDHGQQYYDNKSYRLTSAQHLLNPLDILCEGMKVVENEEFKENEQILQSQSNGYSKSISIEYQEHCNIQLPASQDISRDYSALLEPNDNEELNHRIPSTYEDRNKRGQKILEHFNAGSLSKREREESMESDVTMNPRATKRSSAIYPLREVSDDVPERKYDARDAENQISCHVQSPHLDSPTEMEDFLTTM